jgi:hypothetical protein
MSCNSTSNATADAETGEVSPQNLVLSLLLVVGGAAFVAFSMVVQRYGLAYPEPRVPFCGCRVPRMRVWFVGIVLYGPGNYMKIAAFNLGPQSALGSVFSVVLVFNLFMARWLLKETITGAKIVSSTLILAGAAVSAVGAPPDSQTRFSPADIDTLFATHVPFVMTLSVVVILGAAAVVWMERTYPMTQAARRAIAGATGIESNLKVAGLTDEPPPKLPPSWLHSAMLIVFAGALGLDEALADLFIRAFSAMMVVCLDGCADCATPIFYVCVICWTIAAFGGSLLWMPIVYRRYEVSVALPVEYGAVNVGAVLTGLLFYDEYLWMEPWQLTLQIVGCSLILIGIAVPMLTRWAPGVQARHAAQQPAMVNA